MGCSTSSEGGFANDEPPSQVLKCARTTGMALQVRSSDSTPGPVLDTSPPSAALARNGSTTGLKDSVGPSIGCQMGEAEAAPSATKCMPRELDAASAESGVAGLASCSEPREAAVPDDGGVDYDLLSLGHVHATLSAKPPVLRVCVTGGPCAGKSTLMAQLQTKIPLRSGFKVYCAPEAATMLVSGGLEWNGKYCVQQQLAVLQVQLALEDQFLRLAAATGQPSVVFCDRGTMDGRAFCSEDDFREVLRHAGQPMEVLRDRYDAVLHLVTSAIGAESFYNLDNPARYESLSGAVESDLKLREMYIGHRRLRIIDNSTDFEEKIERGLRFVGEVVGQRFPVIHSTYYLLRRPPSALPTTSAKSVVTTTVLSNSNLDEIRLLVKRRIPSGTLAYFFHSIKRTVGVPVAVQRGSAEERDHAALGDSILSLSGRTSDFDSHPPSPHPPVPEPSVPETAQPPGRPERLTGSGEQQEQTVRREETIGEKEYLGLLQHRDPMRVDVVAEVRHFLYDTYCCEMTTIRSPGWAAGTTTITVECETPSSIELPHFVEIDRELPIEQHSAAYLISHTETGPLYTSLTFAPAFHRPDARRRARSFDPKRGTAVHVNASDPPLSAPGVLGGTPVKEPVARASKDAESAGSVTGGAPLGSCEQGRPSPSAAGAVAIPPEKPPASPAFTRSTVPATRLEATEDAATTSTAQRLQPMRGGGVTRQLQPRAPTLSPKKKSREERDAGNLATAPQRESLVPTPALAPTIVPLCTVASAPEQAPSPPSEPTVPSSKEQPELVAAGTKWNAAARLLDSLDEAPDLRKAR